MGGYLGFQEGRKHGDVVGPLVLSIYDSYKMF